MKGGISNEPTQSIIQRSRFPRRFISCPHRHYRTLTPGSSPHLWHLHRNAHHLRSRKCGNRRRIHFRYHWCWNQHPSNRLCRWREYILCGYRRSRSRFFLLPFGSPSRNKCVSAVVFPRVLTGHNRTFYHFVCKGLHSSYCQCVDGWNMLHSILLAGVLAANCGDYHCVCVLSLTRTAGSSGSPYLFYKKRGYVGVTSLIICMHNYYLFIIILNAKTYFLFTKSLSGLPALNTGAFDAGILISSLV